MSDVLIMKRLQLISIRVQFVLLIVHISQSEPIQNQPNRTDKKSKCRSTSLKCVSTERGIQWSPK